MENLKQFLEDVYTKPLKTKKNSKGSLKINGTISTQIKKMFRQALIKDLQELGIDVYELKKEFVVVIPHEEEGSFPIAINNVMKALDDDTFDYETLAETYAKEEEKKAKEKEKEEQKKGE